MKFQVSSGALQSHILSVSKVIAPKNSIAILESFLFTLKGNELKITASDQETTMVTAVELIVSEGEGQFTISSKLIIDLLKGLPEQPISFEIDDNNFETYIYFTNGKYNFIGVNGNEYPQKNNDFPNILEFTISAENLLNGINNTIYATCDQDIRPILTGILFDIKPEELIFVASDTHKLVRYREPDVKLGVEGSFILPRKPASILKNILSKDDSEVKVEVKDKNIRFTYEGFVLDCRQIEGMFPNYNSVIPKESPYKLNISRTSFLNAVRRVSILSSRGTGLICVNIASNDVTISANDVDFGTSAEEKVICEYTGEDMVIGFNCQYLTEILTNLESENICIELSAPSRPGIIIPKDEENANDDLLVLLMPMMVSEF